MKNDSFYLRTRPMVARVSNTKMLELYQESIRLINFPLTILVGLVTLYWIFVIIGFLDVELFDFDFEMDGDVEPHGAFSKLMNFMHATDTPMFIVLTVLSICMWTLSILSNYYLNSGDSLLIGLGLLIPNFLVSITITRYLILPVHRLFTALSQDKDAKVDIVGQLCETNGNVSHLHGQASIQTSGAPITFNARVADEGDSLSKGEKAVVVRKNKDGTYIIKKLEV